MSSLDEQEILKKAIEKAEDNGFELGDAIPSLGPYEGKISTSLSGMIWIARHGIIFNHDFARALWGERWQHHIQQMVIANDPIKYLEEHI